MNQAELVLLAQLLDAQPKPNRRNVGGKLRDIRNKRRHKEWYNAFTWWRIPTTRYGLTERLEAFNIERGNKINGFFDDRGPYFTLAKKKVYLSNILAQIAGTEPANNPHEEPDNGDT